MSNKRNALILGLTSFSFFFGSMTLTTLADQEENYTTAQITQYSAGQPLNLFGSNSSVAELHLLPRVNANPVPFSENSTSTAEDTAETIPSPSKMPLQPPVSTNPSGLQDQSPTKLNPSKETKSEPTPEPQDPATTSPVEPTKPQQDQSPTKLNPSEEIKPDPTPKSPDPTKPEPKPTSKKKTTRTKAS